jgi:tRNA-splicing ligase RtcB
MARASFADRDHGVVVAIGAGSYDGLDLGEADFASKGGRGWTSAPTRAPTPHSPHCGNVSRPSPPRWPGDAGPGDQSGPVLPIRRHRLRHLKPLRLAIEAVVPIGKGAHTKDALPEIVPSSWAALAPDFARLCAKHPDLEQTNNVVHLGTLGSGNHFVELCLDEEDRVWVMLHSGSRGVGHAIGSRFITAAKEEMARWFVGLPDPDLAYLPEGTALCDDSVEAVQWAQAFAMVNRAVMMRATLQALSSTRLLPGFSVVDGAVNCHHNSVEKEHHFGADVWVTRKGAVCARVGDLGIIPGSMGAKSFIVRGKGHAESFCSCSHGAGRLFSRTEAKRRFTVADHAKATSSVECRKDESVIDETPAAYKPIDAVMAAQADLVDVVHTLRQVVCVKG